MKIVFTTIVLVAAQVAGYGQSGWEGLNKLGPNRRVKVYMNDGRVLKGSWLGSGIRAKDGSEVKLEPGGVTRVTVKSRAKGAMWGGLATFAVAAPVGAYAGPYIADYGNPRLGTRARHALGWGMFCGGIGAGIGALVGAEKTVFRR